MLREHEEVKRLLVKAHRFRAVDRPGFFSLAKDLARMSCGESNTAAFRTS